MRQTTSRMNPAKANPPQKKHIGKYLFLTRVEHIQRVC